MDVLGTAGLDDVVKLFEAQIASIERGREALKLAPLDGRITVSWRDERSSEDEITVPILALGEPSDPRAVLTHYFEIMRNVFRTMNGHEESITECEAYRAIDPASSVRIEDISEDHATWAIAKDTQQVLGSYDPLEAARTIELPVVTAAFVHDRTPYHRALDEQRKTYAQLKWFAHADTSLMIDSLQTYGFEWQKRAIIRGARTALIGRSLGGPAMASYSKHPLTTMIREAALLLDVEYTSTREDLFIPERGSEHRSSAIEEIVDKGESLYARYTSHVPRLMTYAVNERDGRIREADEQARTADEWLYLIE